MLSIIPFGIFAQGPISFGPKIGWNSSRLTTNYSTYVNDLKSGYQGGLFLSLYIKNFYVQPEAYFSIKRGSLETNIGDPLNPVNSLNVSQSVTLKSIDIPFLLGYRVLDLKLARLRIWGGPIASYILNKDYSLSINGVNKSSIITREDFKDAFWSVQFGAGLDVLMLTFDVGYEFGLNDFLSINSLNALNFRNNMFYCSLGWRLF